MIYDNRANRTFDRARADEEAEMARAKQRVLEAADVERIPVGLELRLEPRDWLTLASPYVDRRPTVIVASTHPPIMYELGVGYVRIWGHSPWCGIRPDHGPCIDAMVRVGAVIDAMAVQ
ncbi:hypothetical protein [Plantactinospora sp. BB1]|uniref:hypothetical protein n=1 Tax=Plantactinospora sp. BB1 TaxID=2071627 RepID=UPI000D16DF7F|nr:hypothetical protein [Plantactinospora sp. BB1]AVT36510.1 hypothetical protein C6W10_08500 [Plantactinospora sp. BB1]